MRCEESRELLGPLFDAELSEDEARQVRQHADDCPTCRRLLADLDRLRTEIRSAAGFAMPPSLPDRVRSALDEGSGAVIESARNARAPSAWLRSTWLRSAATHLAAAAVGGFLIFTILSNPSGSTLTASRVAETHMRALQEQRLIAIAHDDPHVVAPWFAGKIDYAPKVSDLAADGYPLLGGRVDSIGDRTLAVLVYGRRRHVVSVMVEPADEGNAGEARADRFRGFHTYRWTDDGFVYWAVSDLNQDELAQLGTLLARAD